MPIDDVLDAPIFRTGGQGQYLTPDTGFPIRQLGTITPGNTARWAADGFIEDGGGGVAQIVVTWPITVGLSSGTAIAPGIGDRISLTFHNPGQFNVYVCQSVTALGNPLPAVVAGPGMLLIPAGATFIVNPSGQDGWNSIAEGSPAALTILEYLS